MENSTAAQEARVLFNAFQKRAVMRISLRNINTEELLEIKCIMENITLFVKSPQFAAVIFDLTNGGLVRITFDDSQVGARFHGIDVRIDPRDTITSKQHIWETSISIGNKLIWNKWEYAYSPPVGRK